MLIIAEIQPNVHLYLQTEHYKLTVLAGAPVNQTL